MESLTTILLVSVACRATLFQPGDSFFVRSDSGGRMADDNNCDCLGSSSSVLLLRFGCFVIYTAPCCCCALSRNSCLKERSRFHIGQQRRRKSSPKGTMAHMGIRGVENPWS